MTTGSAIRDFFVEGRPLVEQAIDLAEQFKSFREAARDKGVDWSQIKSLLKAQILDERDESGEGARVQTIIDKADTAASYADLLGLGNKVAEKNKTRTTGYSIVPREQLVTSEPAAVSHRVITEMAESVPEIPADLSIPDFLRREQS